MAVKYPAPSPEFIKARYFGGPQVPMAIVIHGTVSRDDAGTARDIAKWWQDPPIKTSAHYTVDPKEVIQSVHDHAVAYHCGSNSNCIGVELCDEQTGPASRWADADSTAILKRAARLVAELCLAYGIEAKRPTIAELKSKGKHGVYGHNDSRLAFGGTTHTDPRDFPWDKFMKMVQDEIRAIKAAAMVTKPVVPAPMKRFKLLHAPLHGVDATRAEMQRALSRPGVIGVAFSEAYRHGGYLGKRPLWRAVMGSGRKKDARGRLVERDVILAVRRYRRNLARGIVFASPASTPLKIAPERYITWTIDNFQGRPLAMIGIHPNAAVRRNWRSDRAKAYRKSMQELHLLVGRLRAQYGHDLDIAILGDMNYPEVTDGREWTPRWTFNDLGLDWIDEGIDWVAYSSGLKVVSKRKIPTRVNGQDHPWLEVEFRRV